MATAPAFAATPGSEATAIPATANTNRDGTGTVTTVLTPGASGTRIERIRFKAAGTTTAGMLRVFAHNGTAFFLLDEVPVAAITPSGTVETWEADLYYGDDAPLVLPTGWSLRVSTHNAEAFNCIVIAGDY